MFPLHVMLAALVRWIAGEQQEVIEYLRADRLVLSVETVSGGTNGQRHNESWYAPDSGLLLKRIWSVVGDSSTAVGRAHYTESATIEAE